MSWNIGCFVPLSNMKKCKGAMLHSSSEMIFQLVCELRSRGESSRGGVSDSISSAADRASCVNVLGGGWRHHRGMSLSLSLSPGRLPVEPARDTLFSLNPGLHTPDPHHTQTRRNAALKTTRTLGAKLLCFIRKCHATHPYIRVCVHVI